MYLQLYDLFVPSRNKLFIICYCYSLFDIDGNNWGLNIECQVFISLLFLTSITRFIFT